MGKRGFAIDRDKLLKVSREMVRVQLLYCLLPIIKIRFGQFKIGEQISTRLNPILAVLWSTLVLLL